MKKFISTLALVFGVLFFVHAQEKVDIKGTVKGENGIKIENATITIKDMSTKIQTPIKSDKNGDYTTSIEVGKYVLKFSAPGYATKTVLTEVVGNTVMDMDLVKIQNSKTSKL